MYAAPASSQTFDYGAGDVGYIPMVFSHYIENTGEEEVVLLEMLKAPKFEDISVAQWLGLTPRWVFLCFFLTIFRFSTLYFLWKWGLGEIIGKFWRGFGGRVYGLVWFVLSDFFWTDADEDQLSRQVVKDTLHLPDEVLDNLPKYKPYLISGPTNLTDTNYTKPFGE